MPRPGFNTHLLIQARLRLGWTRAELAKKMGVAEKTIFRWENGSTLPVAHSRVQLATLLLIDPTEVWPLPVPPVPEATAGDSMTPAHYVAASRQPLFDPALPLPLAHELVGRDEELLQLQQYLCQENNSALLALNGLPGVGKTTLATALVHNPAVRARFKDGILWAGLGPEPNIQSHLSRWGALLGMSVSEMSSLNGIEAWAHALHRLIGTRAFLLIIDDVWTLEDALIFKVGGSQCSHLVTTRFPSIAAQIATHGATAIKELDIPESLTLLRALAPQVVEQEPQHAHELVQAVGGLPLALTLLGNYLRGQSYTSPPRQITAALQQLRDASARLKISAPQAPVERHPSLPYNTAISLQTVIAVTDQQLTPQTRQALYALSVFPARPNTFSEEAALAIADCSVNTLDELTDTGLLEISGTDRYSLHQTIADYAHLQLSEQSTYQRLIAYITSFAELYRKDYASLEGESSNILAALEIARAQEYAEELLRIACAFAPFLLARGLYQIAETHLQYAYTLATARSDDEGLASILLYLGEIAWKSGRYEQAESSLQEGLSYARKIDNRERICGLLANLGSICWKGGNYQQAEAYLQEGLELARELDNRERICEQLDILGSIEIRKGNYKQAEIYLAEGLDLARQSKEEELTCTILLNLGVMAAEQGRYREATIYAQESLAIARQLNHQEWISGLLNNLGDIASEQGNFKQALLYFQEGLHIARQIGHQEWISFLLLNLGSTARKQKNFAQAEQYLQESLALAEQINIPQIICHILNELGDLHLDQQEPGQAERDFQKMAATAPAGGQDLFACAQYGLARALVAQKRLAEALQLSAASVTVLESIGHRKRREVRQWHDSLVAAVQGGA